MNEILKLKKEVLCICLFVFTILSLDAQTTFSGIVKDSASNEVLPFVSVNFDKSTIGVFTKEDGSFRISNTTGFIDVSVSFIGYKTYKLKVDANRTTNKTILLKAEDTALNEVIVRPKKEKYSKKENPAVELMKKVIARKDSNNINSQDYYEYEEYERLMIALNDFKPEQAQFKKFKFLPNYVDSSLIDSKKILPISVREKISEVYYRKEAKANKRIVKGYQHEGLDQTIETEGLNAILGQIFSDVSIYDNSITLLLHNFVGPLSTHSSISFYKWYIEDTIQINNESYINLSFTPFNNRDIGFTGNLLISNDASYGVKQAILRAPKNANLNFVDEIVIKHEFHKNEFGKWVPDEFTMAMDISMMEAFKLYVDKTQSFYKIAFNREAEPKIYAEPAPEIRQKGFQKRDEQFWAENRPKLHNKDYRLDDMMADLYQINFIKYTLKLADYMSAGYFATNKNPEKNLVDIGTVMTFFSYNSVEGSRFRLTGATTKNLHKHLYFYGYGAYGLKDNKFKYMAEASWAFNEVEENKDEFPKNLLTVSHKYDMNNLGQRFTHSERDNILMSIKSSKNEKLTYNRSTRINYTREYHSGFSGQITAEHIDEKPAGKLDFKKIDPMGNTSYISGIKSTELSLGLRYAPGEVFFQRRMRRYSIPSEKLVFSLSHTVGLKGVLGGEYNFNKSKFSFQTEKWIAPVGKLRISAEAEKLWGSVPFPMLISPSSNSSFTIQNGNYHLLEPLEFVQDAQMSWEIYYHMGGWLFNRVPLLKRLQWREVFGFRGFYGSLSSRNNPRINKDLMALPDDTHILTSQPYMEYNVGIENIFKFFRIDYVRRLNYLHHDGVSKDGIRISFDVTF